MSSANPDTATDGSIDVVLPARTELASTVRLLAAAFGADLGFSVDEIDDLRLALNEVFTSAAEGGAGGRVSVSFVPADGRLDIVMRAIPPATIELDVLAATILRSVVDDFVDADGEVTFSKSVREAGR